ncbi:MAG: SDR family oxidoreductase [Candidatus Competibacteraceae bacterium]|jgi:short-subunit dehydrogenase|nr:SDR family oxidoreductase [Candidatus Competibacteraceae bacterium]
MTTFANKTLLITGGAMGLGKLFAEKGVQENSRVVLWDINEAALQTTAEQLKAQGGDVHTYVVDVSDYHAIEHAAKQVFEEVGPIDILFNNAGVVVGANFADHTAEQIERTIKINTSGVMHVARAFLPKMLEKGEGHVINIASAAGMISNPKMSVYAGSKWAVIGWSESLRIELQQMGFRNVRVTTVTPSYINTGMFDGAKAPLLTPILEPETIVNAVWNGVKKNRIIVRAPLTVYLIPIMKGLMPTRMFDLIAGKIMGIYKSMEHFKGH